MFPENSIIDAIYPDYLLQTSDIKDRTDTTSSAEIDFQKLQKVNSQTLIKLHKVYGNKWKQISNHFSSIPDSFIKNMFYTLARKALRKVNLYIELSSKLKNRKAKVFKLNFVFKLANLAESERISDSKQNIDSIKRFYTKLLYNLLDVGKVEQDTIKQMVNDESSVHEDSILRSLDGLVENLRTIEKIFIEQNLIKKGRTKKKFPKKGLVEKAYSSQAFKNSLQDFETMSFISLSTHSNQYKQDQFEVQRLQEVDLLCEMRAYQQNDFRSKNDLDNYLEVKAFDPILFQ